MATLTPAALAAKIDHTILKAEATLEQVLRVTDEALTWRTAAVCVNPVHVAAVARRLAGSSVKTCTVVGFPLGATRSSVKAYEAHTALEDGADEIDMVLSLANVIGGEETAIEADVRAVAEIVRVKQGAKLKVIIESAALSNEQIERCCRASKRAGADFVKTSTGFHPAGGASVEAVKLMKKTFGGLVKASGGIRTLEQCEAMIAAGADRLGMSATVDVLKALSGQAPAKPAGAGY